MRVRWMTILLITALGGCASSSEPQRFSIYFEPYSANLDQLANDTIRAAADFARAHAAAPIAVAGFSAPPDPQRDVEGLSARRAEAVKQALVKDGIGAERITTAANGVTDPKTMPQVAVRRVDITVGR
jgi:outer membrane protein OmpA-like peptidoglycan-associated protein